MVLLAGALGIACDDGGSSGGGGTGGGTGSGGGGNGDAVEGSVIFDGNGTWIQADDNEFAIQGAFFVLEDSVENGAPVSDGLEHTDLTPDTFDENTAKPCVSGTVAKVTNADGETCDPSGTDCQWSAQWGGGIGLNLNETGGEGSTMSPIDLTGAGVTGFSFRVSGNTGGAEIRFKVKDAANNSQDFCLTAKDGVNTIMLSELKHECWGATGTLSLDPSQAVQLQWQLVSSASASYTISNFCVDELAVVTD